jgi:hypothetical protein
MPHLSPTPEQMNQTIEQREAERLADLERSEELGRELERSLGVADVLHLPVSYRRLVLVRFGEVLAIECGFTDEPSNVRVADFIASTIDGAEVLEVSPDLDLDALQAYLDEQPRLLLVQSEPANDNVIPLFRSKSA